MVAFFEGRRVHPGVPNIEFGGQGGASRSIKPGMRGRLFFMKNPREKKMHALCVSVRCTIEIANLVLVWVACIPADGTRHATRHATRRKC